MPILEVVSLSTQNYKIKFSAVITAQLYVQAMLQWQNCHKQSAILENMSCTQAIKHGVSSCKSVIYYLLFLYTVSAPKGYS